MCVRVCVNVRISVTRLVGVRCPDVDEITTVRGPSKPQSSCRSEPSAGQGPGALGAGSRESALPAGRKKTLPSLLAVSVPAPGAPAQRADSRPPGRTERLKRRGENTPDQLDTST